MPRPYALLVLAWALVRTLLGRLFGAPNGLRLFRANYDADRLPPFTKEEREELPTMSGCIACGLCDLEGATTARGDGGMALALAGSRSTPDADAAAHAIATLDDAVLAEREAVCPTRVPLVAVARLTRIRATAHERAA
jgi:hypothetical protein